MNEKLATNATLKIGVLVVAYNATNSISNVLGRIKPHTWDRISEVFIFDDSSIDNTSQVAIQYKTDNNLDKVRVFRNQVNLGYGGNQKRGYRYAIENGFDIVILLHGDGQYAPEMLDEMIDPIADGEADAVFGSRMLHKGQALKGGMPLYKFVGNKILTRIQNFLMGARMSEYHSGYRAYNVHALKQLPLMKNSNDFHFDNEIIIQFFDASFRIKEVPIPTYYGNEICYVNGMAYAFNVFKSIFRYRLHKAGLLYARQYDLKGGYKYSFKKNRFSSHQQILKMLGSASKGQRWDVLDIGCGAGFLASHVVAMGHSVVGVDIYDSQEARNACSRFIVADIEQDFGVEPNSQYDCIILADILEHVRNPESVLIRARRFLKPNGRIIASMGNVAHLFIRLELLLGNFVYTERGILDRTHCRLFTRKSFIKLLSDCGFNIIQKKAAPLPFDAVITGRPLLSDALCAINMSFAALWPSLFAYQIITEALIDSKATELLRLEEIHGAEYVEYKPPQERMT